MILRDKAQGVKFDTEGYQAVKYSKEDKSSKMINWLIKGSGGLIRSQRQAEIILLIFALAVITYSVYIAIDSTRDHRSAAPVEGYDTN